jgi:hypothetical protein
VLPTTIDGWLRTDAHLDFGNSGGPVVNGSAVIGVAVAKGIDQNGDFVAGYFVPASVAIAGLVYANDSRFGFDVSKLPASSSRSSRSSSSSSRSSSVSSRSSSRSSIPSSRAGRSSSRSSARPAANSFEARTCERVARRFMDDEAMLARVNKRLLNRFGFACR